MKYVPPTIREAAFNCPYCKAFAHQQWFGVGARTLSNTMSATDALINHLSYSQKDDPKLFNLKHGQTDTGISGTLASRCVSCDKVALWVCSDLIYPRTGGAPLANPDMSEDIRRDYDEASAILDLSPRGAAAIIRLAIQKLCRQLGQRGERINDDIGALVKGGLDPRVQQALDAVWVIGNNAVHPGQIDLRDDRATAETLFKLLNFIVDKTISEPKHVAEVFAALPKGALQAIERRDGNS